MDQYRLECEECESTTYVFTYEEPTFCPVCGRRPDVEPVVEDFDNE